MANKPKKKVLIISYYWPPCGGIAVLRCLKIAKYLRDYDWEPIIFTAEGAHYPSIDDSNNKDILPDMEVIKCKIWEPYHIYKFITGQKKEANVNNVFYTKDKKLGKLHRLSVWIRSNFFIPDARALWINPSVKFLLNYLKENPVDAIFSDGPPHSNTRIATILKQKTSIPWLADFQDPWTQVDYYSLLSLTRWGDRKHHKLEKQAFQAADKITIVSPTWKKELEQIGAKNVSVINWGFDPDDYKNLNLPIDKKFTITHLGILGYDRNAEFLFKALKSLSQTIPGFKEDMELRLVGQVDYSVIETYRKYGIEAQVKLVGSVSRKEALDKMSASVLLLLLLNQQANAKGRMPGKLFEYLAVKRPILSLGPTNGDVAAIISKSKSGVSAEYNDFDSIKQTLLNYYFEYKKGDLNQSISSEIEEYSIKLLTKRIARYLNEIAN